jgi:pantetheine-phosphate adenylyltransferase
MKRVGLYPGTFDPLTNGHLDIVRRAVKLVDQLVIGVTTNPSKSAIFSTKERVEIIDHECSGIKGKGLGRITVQAFDMLLIRFAEKIGASIIVRGLRAVSDFEYEFQMVGMNSRLNSQIETVFLMAEAKNQAIASRLVKEVAMFGGDISSFVTPYVQQKLLAKIAKRGKKS